VIVVGATAGELLLAASTASRDNGPSRCRAASHQQNCEQLAGDGGATCRAGCCHGVRLGNGSVRGLPAIRSVNVDLVLSLDAIGLQPAAHRQPLGVGHDRESLNAAGKGSASALRRKQEHYRCPGDRLVIFILHTDDGIARRALANVIDGAFALNDHQVERLLRKGTRRSQQSCQENCEETHCPPLWLIAHCKTNYRPTTFGKSMARRCRRQDRQRYVTPAVFAAGADIGGSCNGTYAVWAAYP
jgi:hypothetical protein